MMTKITQSLLTTLLFSTPVLTPLQAMAESSPIVAASQTHLYSLRDLGVNGTLKLQGNQSTGYLNFGMRLDEIATSARLSLAYMTSPALLERASHVKVYLNNQLMKVIQFDSRSNDRLSSVIIELDRAFITDYNQLKFELIGYTDDLCQDPARANIWFEVSDTSQLELNTDSLQLANNLSLLPAPFLDVRDGRNVSIPLIFGPNAPIAVLKQSGIVASYFAALADWRETDFLIVDNALPQANAVVMVTNDNKPAFLADMADVDGPYLQIIDNPASEYHKLLLIMGRDDTDLEKAVLGLITNHAILNGPISRVDAIQAPPPRLPYDAPNWIDTTTAVKFAQIVSEKYQLEQKGNAAGAIGFDFRLPPDLFVWNSKGAELGLSYRYSPLRDDQISQLTVSINNQFSGAFPLKEINGGDAFNSMYLPLVDGITAARSAAPTISQGNRNQLGLQFQFATGHRGECLTERVNTHFGSVDPNSTIDFSSFPHYIAMPNLTTFATSAFPFSRVADLSETLVLLPENLKHGDRQSYVNFMAFVGGITGYPGYRVAISQAGTESDYINKDIFAINPTQAKRIELGMKTNRLEFNDQGAVTVSDVLQNHETPLNRTQNDASLTQSGALAGLSSFESAATKQRTVVTMNLSTDKAIEYIAPLFTHSIDSSTIYGSTVVFNANEVKSYASDDYYYVGSLPWIKFIWFHASQHAKSLLIGLLVVLFGFGYIAWRTLLGIARRRTQKRND
jgi:hypothetical protein